MKVTPLSDEDFFVAPFRTLDPNLGLMLESHLEGASLSMVKMRLRAAVAKVIRTNGDDPIRAELAAILEDIAANGMPMPRDLDVALDAILCTVGIQI